MPSFGSKVGSMARRKPVKSPGMNLDVAGL
jgi:hypothetical protein